MAWGPVYYDELMERRYLVYYDEAGEPLFVVYDEYGDPMDRFPRLNRADRKPLETCLRAQLAAFNRRVEELERETDGIEDVFAQGRAINDQLKSEGWPYDLELALEELEEVHTPVERVSDLLMK